MLKRRSLTPGRLVLGVAPVFLVATAMTAMSPTESSHAGEAAEPAPETQCGASCGEDDNVSPPSTDDGGVSIRVWGTATEGGEDGYEIPPETVVVLPPCRYFQTTWSGKDYYEGIENGTIGQYPTPDREPYETYPDYEKYKDDEDGRWWAGMCDSGDFDGDIDEFSDYSEQWFDEEYEPVYVEQNEQPPVPPIPPEVLVEVAYDEMTLPDPEIGWNPKRDGDSATFVNLDTWMWLDGGPTALEINAEAGENHARVDATLGSMNFSAPSADPVSCDGAGTEWTPGASSTDCSLVFERSSANQPGGVTTVTAESQWDIEWFANGEPRGALDPQTTSSTFDLPVAEAQSIVTD